MHPTLYYFWEYIDAQLDETLGGHRLDDTRRDYGSFSEYAMDCEGTHWFGDDTDEYVASRHGEEE